MKTVCLYDSKNRKFVIDKDNLEIVSLYKWQIRKTGSKKYNQKSYVAAHIKDKDGIFRTVFLHRLITNCPKTFQVDHIDGNPLNNSKSNLRIVTPSENKRNVLARGTSKYLGVHFTKEKRNKRWVSSIKIQNKYKHLGRFLTEKEAAKAYNDALIEYDIKCGRPNNV